MSKRLVVALGIASASLRANLLRSALATLGVVIGVAALVAVLSLGDGMERYMRDRIQGQGYQAVTIAPIESDELDGIAIRRKNIIEVTVADAIALRQALPSGSTVQLIKQGVTTLTSSGSTKPRGARVLGALAPEILPQFKLKTGSFYAEGDTNAVVVSHALATQIAAPQAPERAVGSTIRFASGAERKVVGIVEPTDGKLGNLVIAPVAAAAPIIDTTDPRGGPTFMEASASSIEGVQEVRDAVNRWVAARFPNHQSVLRVASLRQNRLEDLQRGILLFKLFMGAIVGISLVVGGIGIMNVLLASVSERTREIGIRKAAGATHGAVLQQFLAESVVITGLGALAGMVLGLIAAFGFAAVMRRITEAEMHAGFNPVSLLIAAAISIFVGLAFGTYPALRAARLSPIDAIRHES